MHQDPGAQDPRKYEEAAARAEAWAAEWQQMQRHTPLHDCDVHGLQKDIADIEKQLIVLRRRQEIIRMELDALKRIGPIANLDKRHSYHDYE